MFAVAPSAGAWIEIHTSSSPQTSAAVVAPSAGAWIEMSVTEAVARFQAGRSLRGSVD